MLGFILITRTYHFYRIQALNKVTIGNIANQEFKAYSAKTYNNFEEVFNDVENLENVYSFKNGIFIFENNNILNKHSEIQIFSIKKEFFTIGYSNLKKINNFNEYGNKDFNDYFIFKIYENNFRKYLPRFVYWVIQPFVDTEYLFTFLFYLCFLHFAVLF